MARPSEHLSILVELFLQYLSVRKGRSHTTINTYRSALNLFVEYVEDCTIDELTIPKIDQYALSLGNLKPKTLKNKLTPIRSFVKFLYAKEYTTLRAESIDLPVVTEIEANFLDEDEQERLIAACESLRDRALILFLLRSGLRVGELIDAKVSDLHKRSLVVPNGKGGKPRITFISKDAEYAVKAYHDTLPPQTYLFPSITGKKISRQYIARVVTNIAAKAKIQKKVSPHTLRHTFATNLLMRGARIEDVQPMLGHSNMRTTRIYLHFTNDYLHKRYDDVMNSPTTY